MTSELNEDAMNKDSIKTKSLVSNNNDVTLKCISSLVSSSELSNCQETNNCSDSTLMSSTQDGDNVHAEKSDHKSVSSFSSIRGNNETKLLEPKGTCNSIATISDKCPSRWITEVSGNTVQNDSRSSQALKTTINLNDQTTFSEEKLPLETRDPSSQNCLINDNTCDQDKCIVIQPGFNERSLAYKSVLYPLGEERELLGKEAIEELATELNKAASTIRDFAHSECDEQILKELNDEQLFKLLEEAYHSKKLDEKNKSSIFKEILEDVHESINAGGKKVLTNNTMTTESDNDCLDNLRATKELLQTKILGLDEGRTKSILMPPKVNKIATRIPSNYQWKDNVKNEKDAVSAGVRLNDKQESPCVWNARTTSTKSVDTTKHSNSSFICNHTNKARQEDMHLSNEIDQDTSLGAIQKNNLPNSVDMMSNTGTNPRRFGENANCRNLDENGNPINMSGMEPRLPRPSLGLGSVSMGACNTTSATCRQLRPLSIYRHNPAFHSQHVAAVGGSNQINSDDCSNLSDSSPPAPTLQQRHQQQRIPSPTPIPSPFSSSMAMATPTHPITEDMEKVASLNSNTKSLRKKKKAVKTNMIKAEEIDGYRGCDDLDSILEFIEKGDEKKAKSGSKRNGTLGRSRVESPNLAGSVSRKQLSKQQTQGKSAVNSSLEIVPKTNNATKKGAHKRAQTPSDGNMSPKNNKVPNTDAESSSDISPPMVGGNVERTSPSRTSHSTSPQKDTGNQDDYTKNETESVKISNDGESRDDSHNVISKFLDDEDYDDDDTPFVMIRRVNNYSNQNKVNKGKNNVDGGTKGASTNKNMALANSVSRNGNNNNNNPINNNRHGSKLNTNSSTRNTLKRKSKTGSNGAEEHQTKGNTDHVVSTLKSGPPTSTTLNVNKANGNGCNYINDKDDFHLPANGNKVISDGGVFKPRANNFQSLSATTTTSARDIEELDEKLCVSNERDCENQIPSFSSIVQEKKSNTNKASRGKSKGKGGGSGLSHKQYIDAALNDPTDNSSKQETPDNSKHSNNCSDNSNKLKISNTFMAEAMLPEPVLEYSRKHSSHSPPPTQQCVDLMATTNPLNFSVSQAENQWEEKFNPVKEIKSDSIQQLDFKAQSKVSSFEYDQSINTKSINHASTANDNIKYDESLKNIEYTSNDMIIDSKDDDKIKSSQECNKNFTKSYSSAVISKASQCHSHPSDQIDDNMILQEQIIGDTYNKDVDLEDESHVEIFQYENIAEEERSIEVEEFKVNDLGRKPKRLSTSTSPISSRSSSLTWYEEDDDCTEGTFNYTTILNFIKSEWESIAAEISTGSKNEHPKVVYYKT